MPISEADDGLFDIGRFDHAEFDKQPAINYGKPEAKVVITESENGNQHTVVDSRDDSHNFLEGSLSIDGSVKEAVDGFDFQLVNKDSALDFISANDEVEIYLGYYKPLTRVMRGKITKPKEDFGPDGQILTIEGEDFGQLLQQRVAAEVYLNEDVKDIVTDLIVKYAPEIDTSAVQAPNVTLESHRVAYQSLFTVIQDLAERVDYQFYVDNEKVLHFEPKGFEDTNRTFTEAETVKSFSKTPNLKKLVNEVIVFGGKRAVREEEKFSGDGSTTTFTTTYKPHDPDVFVDGTQLRGGAEGTQDLSEVDYVYDIDTREFTFATDPSSGTDNVTINYTRYIPIQAIKRDESSIAEYGKHQKRVVDQNITRQAEAEAIADRVISDYSEPPDEIEATIIGVHELYAGQTVEFDVPSMNVNTEKLDIINISYHWGENGYTMRLTLNEEPRGVEEAIKDIRKEVDTTKGLDSGVLDLIRKLQDYSDALNISEVLNVDKRSINDSFILGHPTDQNSELGTAKLGDRRGTYSDLIDVNS